MEVKMCFALGRKGSKEESGTIQKSNNNPPGDFVLSPTRRVVSLLKIEPVSAVSFVKAGRDRGDRGRIFGVQHGGGVRHGAGPLAKVTGGVDFTPSVNGDCFVSLESAATSVRVVL